MEFIIRIHEDIITIIRGRVVSVNGTDRGGK